MGPIFDWTVIYYKNWLCRFLIVAKINQKNKSNVRSFCELYFYTTKVKKNKTSVAYPEFTLIIRPLLFLFCKKKKYSFDVFKKKEQAQ